MPPKNPDLNLLPIAVALYDALSVSRAARQLGMSQPAVSKALRRLRETFDDPLFVRSPRGIVPTPRAHAIVRAARPHLQHLQEGLLRGERFDPVASTRPVTLAVSDVAEMAFFPSIVDHFHACAPRCPVRTVSVPDSQLAQGLETGDIDLAAGYFPALAQRNFRQRRLSKHGFACLMRVGHPLWRSRLTVSGFLAAEHIVVHSEGRSLDVLERFIERRKMRRKIAVYTSHVLSAPFIVMESQLLATLPFAVVTRFASLTSQVAAALPPFDIQYDLKLHWHRRFDNDPRSRWLREQLAAVFKDHKWLTPPSGPAPFLES
ncbi:MAG TPA: LysR family transcriptional regulator [Vicinamibacterales bacterium]|nr:LysR family transcriptional regulator [Vicinamibacterales bacterium]